MSENTDKNKKPAIRFKGFQDSWEQRKVTELGKIYIGLVTTMTKHYTNEGTLLIRNSDIKDGRFEFGDKPIYLENSFAQDNESRMHQVGDVITVHTGDVGTSAVITENEAKSIGFATIVTRPDPQIIDPNYLCTFLNTDKHKKWAVAISTGDGRTNYNLGDYYELVVPVPSIREQQKISSFVQNLNNLITLHQRKLEKLKNVKKSMLEKMFPKNGSNVPEIRFAGFTAPWEQRKVGELSEKTFGGGTPNTSNNEYWNGDIPWFQSSDIPDGKLFNVAPKKFISQDGLSKSAAQLIPENSIAIITRVGVGKLAFVPFSYTTSQDFLSLSKLKTEPFFTVYACYKKLQSELNAVQGTSIKGITKDELLAKQIMIPNYAEQRQIGSYFRNLDNLITLHQHKLEKLQNIKKSMLEKMFV